jgi:hypothetical protein
MTENAQNGLAREFQSLLDAYERLDDALERIGYWARANAEGILAALRDGETQPAEQPNAAQEKLEPSTGVAPRAVSSAESPVAAPSPQDGLVEELERIRKNGCRINEERIVFTLSNAEVLQCIAALRSPQPAEQQEAVAWNIWWDNEKWLLTSHSDDYEAARSRGWTIIPLYAHSTSVAPREAKPSEGAQRDAERCTCPRSCIVTGRCTCGCESCKREATAIAALSRRPA